MKIGIIKEIKDKEYRVAVSPSGVKALRLAGHHVVLETNAGAGSGFSDQEYQSAGAHIVTTREAWAVDLVVKVKEPLQSEYQYFKQQMIFTYFHLAGTTKDLTLNLLKKEITAIAYETLEDEQGQLPLLAPMSAIAGNMATLMGSYYLATTYGGKGMQLGKVLGKQYGKVLVIGDGIVGQHAAYVASSMGAQVYLFGIQQDKGIRLKQSLLPDINFVISSHENIQRHIIDADVVIGAVLLRGAKAPYVIDEEMVKQMPAGSVIVDVSIDQGGCIATSRPTSHSDPVFTLHDVIHYCVTNMPGAYPRTSTLALTECTLPYLLQLANNGLDAFIAVEGLKKSINTHQGKLTYRAVAEELDLMADYSAL